MRQKNAKLNIARLLSMALTAVLILTLLAALLVPCVFADESDTAPDVGDIEILPEYDPYADEIDWDRVATSGSCGENLTWVYENATITITGQGEMTNFKEPDMAPWYPLRRVIRHVSLPDGLTNVGTLAFYGCANIKMVRIPDSVVKIGAYAFAGCEELTVLTLGNRLSTIGRAAFYNCYKLDGITFPYSLETIGAQAFYRCESLTAVTLPKYVQNVGASVFAYCKNLILVEIFAALKSLPEWTFYGCENLTVVILPETISKVNNYAFTQCDGLTTVYFDGQKDKKEQIQADIAKDIPWFMSSGYISDGIPAASTTSGQYRENKNGTVTQKNTTVSKNENMQIVSVVQHTYMPGFAIGGSVKTDITVTVENKDVWQDVVDVIMDTIKDVDETTTQVGAEFNTVGVTLYVKTEGNVDTTLVEGLVGDDVKMTVVTQNGSEFRMELEDIKQENLSGNYDYSYTVGNTTKENCDQLGTDDCFGLTFKESAQINAEVVIPLPENEGASNAYLYQVEADKSLTRLQAVAVDKDGNAHFYLGAVDKDTEYVIGVNVPNERTDDVIYPDELLVQDSDTQNAIIRLEKIEYVITGRESTWGMGAMQVTWIMLAVIAVCVVVVGVIMAIWNKRRLERGYVPEIEYEIEE